ncbi:MAG: hypothetical protein LBP87_12100 [Planctomycetaceae bacterium]|nr:hypothetical protein [Planctomycetaceae bacterium]
MKLYITKKSRLLNITLMFVVVFGLQNICKAETSNSETIATIKTFPAVTEKFVATTNFDTPDDAARPLQQGFAIKAGEGRNGTSALFYERTDPNVYIFDSIPLKNLVPNVHYVAKVWIRTEGIQALNNQVPHFRAICIEYSLNGKWAGGFYGIEPQAKTEWQQISLPFTAVPESSMGLIFILDRGITGKIWFDDVEIYTDAEITSAILLTRPDRLSFFGEKNSFTFHTEPPLPKQAALLATIVNDGKTQEILCRQNSHDFIGNVENLKPGSVEITAKLADLETKTIVSKQKFQLNAYPATEPPKNACIIDEYNRAIVNGKPFMPLGVFCFTAYERDYQRLKEAGFNCLQMYESLRLKGNTDNKDDVKNIREGLDLIDKYGLKLIFSLKDQFPHHGILCREQWGGVEGFEAVTEHAVKTVKEHSALLAWYISDEESQQNVPLVLGLRQRISRIDAWHPTWTLTNHPGYLPYYGISGDVIGFDPYPISEIEIEQNIREIKPSMTACHSTSLPVWVVPQIFNWGIYKAIKNNPEEFAKSHFPTLEEMRAMPLYAAMLGAKGFVFYNYSDVCAHYGVHLPPNSGIPEREWTKVVEMVKPLKELEPFILSTKKPQLITVESEPKNAVEAGVLLNDDGDYRIIIIGTGGKVKGTFTLPENLRQMKNEFRSKYGKTKSLGNGKYEFTANGVDSDILESKNKKLNQ